MANQTGRPVATPRKLVAAVMGTIAVFVMALGLGMSSWGVALFGLAVLVLSIGLGVVNVVRRGARAWVSGTAEVKAISPAPTSSAVYGRAEIQAVVVAPGLPTSEVTLREPRVPVVKWPHIGDTLPITVDVDDMRRVRINWDEASPRDRGQDPPPPPMPDYGDLPDDVLDEEDDDILGDVEDPPWVNRNRQWAEPEEEEPPPPPPGPGESPVVVRDTPAGPVVEGEFVDHNETTQQLPRRAAASGAAAAAAGAAGAGATGGDVAGAGSGGSAAAGADGPDADVDAGGPGSGVGEDAPGAGVGAGGAGVGTGAPGAGGPGSGAGAAGAGVSGAGARAGAAGAGVGAAGASGVGVGGGGVRESGSRPSPRPRNGTGVRPGGGSATATAEPLVEERAEPLVEEAAQPPGGETARAETARPFGGEAASTAPSQRAPHPDDELHGEESPVDVALDEPVAPGLYRRPEPTVAATAATPSPTTSYPTAPEPVTSPPHAPEPTQARPTAPPPAGYDDIDLPLDGEPGPTPETTEPAAAEAMDEGLIAPPAPDQRPEEQGGPVSVPPVAGSASAAPESRARTTFVSNAAHEAEATTEQLPTTPRAEGKPAHSAGVMAGAAAAAGAVAAAAAAAFKKFGHPDKGEQADKTPAAPQTATESAAAAPPAAAAGAAAGPAVADAGPAAPAGGVAPSGGDVAGGGVAPSGGDVAGGGVAPSGAGAAGGDVAGGDVAGGSAASSGGGGAGAGAAPSGGAAVAGAVVGGAAAGAAAAGAAAAGARGAGGTGSRGGGGEENPWAAPPSVVPAAVTVEPDERVNDVITAYPSARPGPTGAIYGVGLTVLVTDLGRSVAFYRDTLGFYEIDSGDGSAVLASGDTRVVLRTVSGLAGAAGRLVFLNLEVGDVEAVYHELVAKGVTFEHPPQPVNRGDRLELWSATFHDPDEHNIAITQWRAIR